MAVAIRAITRIQDGDDVNVTPGAGMDGKLFAYDHASGKFVLSEPPFDMRGRVLTTQRANLVAYWPLNETAGPTAHDLSGHTEDLALNPGFEDAGAGGADVFADWTESAGDGAIAQTTTEGEFRSGSAAAKLTSGPLTNTFIGLTVPYLLEGSVITFRFWTRGDNTAAGRYRVWDAQGCSDIITYTSTGVAGVTFQPVTVSFTVPAGCTAVSLRFYSPQSNGSWACFDDVVVNVPMHQGISTTGVSYNNPGLGDGRGALGFDGNNSHVLFNSPALNAAFDPNKGSIVGWSKVDDAATWADTSTARWWYHPRAADVDFYMAVGKELAANTLGFRRRAGSGEALAKITYTYSGTEWFQWGMTWDVSANELIAYINGAEVGRTTCTGTWDMTANPIAATGSSVLYAGSITLQEWLGYGAHVALWADCVLTATEMMVLGGQLNL